VSGAWNGTAGSDEKIFVCGQGHTRASSQSSNAFEQWLDLMYGDMSFSKKTKLTYPT